MKRKKIILITIILIILPLLIPILSFANSKPPEISSPASILVDSASGKILYEKESKKRMYPASTTKMMTAILTIENCNLSDIVTVHESAVSKDAVPYGYVSAHLVAGEKFTVEQLLHVLLIPSANDAANVLAEHISGSVKEFSNLMNKKAKEIGCLDTNFLNPSGIHDDNHYSTAYDLSLIAQYGMRNDIFKNIVCKTYYKLPTTDLYKIDDREFNTTNELLKNKKNSTYNYYYESAIGIKTGYTEYANKCLVASAKKETREFICVVLGAEDTETNKSNRAIDCINLFNYAFENYKEKIFISKDTIVKEIEFDVKNIKDKDINSNNKKILHIVPENNLTLYTTTDIEEIVPNITINNDLTKPIIKGDIVGKIEYVIDDTLYTINLIANDDIIDFSYVNYIFHLLLIILLFTILFKIKLTTRKNNAKNSFDYKKLKY